MSGERVNMIVWLFGEHGVVRVAPHEEQERLLAHQRWGAAAAEDARAVPPWLVRDRATDSTPEREDELDRAAYDEL